MGRKEELIAKIQELMWKPCSQLFSLVQCSLRLAKKPGKNKGLGSASIGVRA